MDQNQAVNRGGATEFFQAWKNKEKKSCCENKGPKITLCIPQKFLGEQQTVHVSCDPFQATGSHSAHE